MVLFLFLIGGSLTVVFASPSITDVLSTWLMNKTDESIQEIDQEIQAEQAKQTERLKAELEAEIANLEEEFEVFLESEKEKRVQAIEAYAEERIQEIPEMINGEARKAEIEAEIDQIFQEAMEAIHQVDINVEAPEQEIEEPEAEVEEESEEPE